MMPRIFKVEAEAHAKRKVFIAAPTFGQFTPNFVSSLWSTQYALKAAGISATLCILAENCHVDDGRNLLVREFLESDCSDLIFIDADLGWDPVSIIKVLVTDKDVVGGSYPLKQKEGEFPIQTIGGNLYADKDGCIEVNGIPTGFMRIKRSVLEELYRTSNKFKGKNERPDKKPIGIIFERLFENNERIGGDYGFCKKAREAGFGIYVIPEMSFEHVGTMGFTGELGEFWKRKHGVYKQLYLEGIEKVKAGTETYEDIVNICKHWGNIPWAAGAGLVHQWVKMARNASTILECGSGITSILAAIANPEATVYALEADRDWKFKVSMEAADLGIQNLNIISSKIENGWYSKETLPFADLVMVDGPPRDKSDRTIALDKIFSKTFVWDDMDHQEFIDRVKNKCETNGFSFEIVKHDTKNYAIARKNAS